jgi:hypothetical protein
MSYNLYFSITKEDFKKPIPDSLQGKFSRIVANEQEEESVEVASSWEEAAEWGMFPWVRKCVDWNTQGMDNNLKVAIIKGEFSCIQGEVSALLEMGAGKVFPFNSVLTKSEAQALGRGEMFTVPEEEI